ncbi:MAG: hypothetical protein K0S67_1278 [Nitrososphaeraceae archaeon]|nr:hypothetical protein [Nitrososphaeraceae archaeon]
MTRWFNTKDFSRNSNEIDQLIQTINEQSAEQRQIVDSFKNIRGKLVECYVYYARLLEKEVIRLSKIKDMKDSQK